MSSMNDGPNVIKPSQIAAAKLKVAIADRKGEKIPPWIRELASRDISSSKVRNDPGQSSAHAAPPLSSQPEPGPSRPPSPPVGFLDVKEISYVQPYADEIWKRLLHLALQGKADPSGREIFTDSDEDATAWDSYAIHGLPTDKNVWLLAALRAAGNARKTRPA